MNSSVSPLPTRAAISSQTFTRPRIVVALLLLLSGFAGLAYQIVWTQQLGIWLGHEIAAALAVVAAFFAGLALGAWRLGRIAATHSRPGRFYAQLELLIAVWALLLIALLPQLGAWLTRLIGAEPSAGWHWLVAFLGPLVLLLPATTAMGATLPALQALLGGLKQRGYAIGGLYAANTAGAVAGVLIAAFVLAPMIGFNATAGVAVSLNLACALIAWRGCATPIRPSATQAISAEQRSHAPLARLALTGLLGIGYEVLIVRIASQIAENTVYTYALLLAVYLLGTAIGAAIYQRWMAGHADRMSLRSRLLALTVLAVITGAAAMHFGPALKPLIASLVGGSFEAALGAEAALALLAFLLPTFAMGALFSHLCVEAHDAGGTLGDALAINTLGAALAAPLVAVMLLPILGPSGLIALIALGYLLLVQAAQLRTPVVALSVAALIAWAVLRPSLSAIDLPPGGQVLSHHDGVMAAVSVIEDAHGERRLHINNQVQEGSNATRLSDARMAWLPLLLHPAPTEVLFLGIGTGITSSSAAADARLRVDAVELLPEVIDATTAFVPADARKPRFIVGDARRHVRASTARYDVVIADLFHPARSGSGALFTVEHFAAVRERLADGGLFCQWLPLHQLDLDSLRSIVAAFLQTYPDATAVLATGSLDTPVVGLIGRRGSGVLDHAALESRFAAAQAGGAIDDLQFEDALVAPGAIVADRRSLRDFAAGAVPNRDDHPVIAYRAPRLAYAPDSTPRERLAALLDLWQAEPALVFSRADAERDPRIAAYWRARKAFLLAGMRVQAQADPRRLLAQVAEPLLGVLRISPDFRPAYDPLYRIALAVAPQAPDEARAVLDALARIQPARPEAVAALRRFTPATPR